MVRLWQNSKCGQHISGPTIRDKYLLPGGKETLSLTDTQLEQEGFERTLF